MALLLAASLAGATAVTLPVLAIESPTGGDEWGLTDVEPADRTIAGGEIQVAGVCKSDGRPADAVGVLLYRVTHGPDDRYYSQDVYFTPDSTGRWSGELSVATDAPADDYQLGAECYAGDRVFGLEWQPYEILSADSLPTRAAVPNGDALDTGHGRGELADPNVGVRRGGSVFPALAEASSSGSVVVLGDEGRSSSWDQERRRRLGVALGLLAAITVVLALPRVRARSRSRRLGADRVV